MIANYHSHATRCHHAKGTMRDYVEEAIRGGYKIWGFSDHTPYPFDNGYVSPIRMLPEELDSYVSEALELKREYKNEIEIKVGLEVEYYPKHFDALMNLCEDYPIEYFLLAQHHTQNEYDGHYTGFPHEEEEILAQYCAQIKEALDTGKFLYLAHPDLPHFLGDEQIYDRHMRDLCESLKAHHIPAEINFLGMWDHRNYPDERFWQIAGEVGIDVVFGTDTHSPDKVTLPECEFRAREMVTKYQLRLIEQIC